MSEHWTEIEVPSFFNKYALSIDNNLREYMIECIDRSSKLLSELDCSKNR